MTKRTFESIDKKGKQTTWEWEETPAVLEALKKLHGPKYDVSKKEVK